MMHIATGYWEPNAMDHQYKKVPQVQYYTGALKHNYVASFPDLFPDFQCCMPPAFQCATLKSWEWAWG